MRLVACADVHGAYAVVDRILREEPGTDILLIAGDLTTLGTAAEATAAVDRWEGSGCRILAVGGNMDPDPVGGALANKGVSLDGQGVIVEGVGFFGVSGAPLSPLHTPSEHHEEDLLERAENGWRLVEACSKKIFVPHAPPFGTSLDILAGGDHVGSTAVRDVVLRHRPDLTICGHIHEARGADRLGTVPVINCGPAFKGYYAVVTLGDEIHVTLKHLAS